MQRTLRQERRVFPLKSKRFAEVEEPETEVFFVRKEKIALGFIEHEIYDVHRLLSDALRRQDYRCFSCFKIYFPDIVSERDYSLVPCVRIGFCTDMVRYRAKDNRY